VANEVITVAALIVAAAQLVFFYNMIWSYFRGPKADSNPWGATTLEWQTPTPPPHGNFSKPVHVYRGPYEYSVPGAARDFSPQYEA
jgi:cytochrome c oxidase subunit 1